MTEKIKQINKFNLENFSNQKVAKRSFALTLGQKAYIALISGGLLSLSSPGFDQWWLAWFMVAPLLVLLRFCQHDLESILVSACFAMAYHLISLHYYLFIVGSSFQISVVVWLLQSLMLSVPTIIFGWFISFLPFRPGFLPYYRRPFFPNLLTVPLLWTFLHWGISVMQPFGALWDLAPLPPLPTDSLVYSQYSQVALLQFLKSAGPQGLEFVMILANTAVASFVFELIKPEDGPVERLDSMSPRFGSLVDLCIVVLVLAGLYSYGHLRVDELISKSKIFFKANGTDEKSQPILAIGAACNDDWLFVDKPINKALAIVVIPEFQNQKTVSESIRILRAAESLSRRNKNSVLLSFRNEYNELIRNNVVSYKGKSVNLQQQIHNPGGSARLAKSKINSKLTKPIVGSVPYWLQEWLFKIRKHDKSSWYFLGNPKIDWGKIGLLSGADITDPRLASYEARKGASLLVSSINLSWMRNRLLNRQLLAAAIFRAVENNRYFILSVNGGVMAIIEPSGLVQAVLFQTTENKGSKILLGTVQLLSSKTSFTKAWWL